MKLRNFIYGCIHINNKLQVGFTNPTVTLIYKLIVATIAKWTINVMQYDGKWASSYANFGIALQFISEWSSGCDFVKLFKKFPRPEDIKIIKLLKWLVMYYLTKIEKYICWVKTQPCLTIFCKIKWKRDRDLVWPGFRNL